MLKDDIRHFLNVKHDDIKYRIYYDSIDSYITINYKTDDTLNIVLLEESILIQNIEKYWINTPEGNREEENFHKIRLIPYDSIKYIETLRG